MNAFGTRISRTYEPDDPELGNKRVQPFRLHELEHIPRDHRDIYQGLLRSMPEAVFEPGFADRACELVKQYTGMQVDLFLDQFRVLDTTRLRALIPGHTCLLIIGLAPRVEKLVLEVDLNFAYRVVGHLLGTKGKPIDIHRPLTEIEQGVFLFVALKIVALFYEGWINPEQLAIRIEDVRNDIRSTAEILRTEHRWMCVSWKLSYDIDVGHLRLLVPESLSRGMFLTRPEPGSALAERVRGRIRERMPILSGLPVEAWTEVGRIELTPADFEQLEPGDIILLEDSQVALDNGELVGPAAMRIGLGRRGVMPGILHSQNGQHVFEIQQIVIEEQPDVHDPIEGHGEFDNPEQVVAEYEDHAGEGGYDEGGYDEGGYDEGGYDEEGYDDYDYDEEGDDGDVTADDVRDEDWGIDDEDDGDDEDYGYDDEGYDEGGYDEGGYDEGDGGYDEGGYDEGGYDEGGGQAAADDNLQEAEPLLGDIPMVVVVELGRVQLTADEVIRLRAGQLVELGRSPTDPVDLVVNGKLVAKGELVEIEGSLGVKLVSLVKGGVG